MGIFGKKETITTLMLSIFLFEDFDHQRPEQTQSGAEKFAQPIAAAVLREHYYEQLCPPKKWNYDYRVKVMPNSTDPAFSRFDFRDPETKEISDTEKYHELCSTMKMLWKEQLLKRFPKYNRSKLEDGFENIKFTYSPEACTLTASVLMEGLMKQE